MQMTMTCALIMALSFAFILGYPVNREVGGPDVDSEGKLYYDMFVLLIDWLIHSFIDWLIGWLVGKKLYSRRGHYKARLGWLTLIKLNVGFREHKLC